MRVCSLEVAFFREDSLCADVGQLGSDRLGDDGGLTRPPWTKDVPCTKRSLAFHRLPPEKFSHFLLQKIGVSWVKDGLSWREENQGGSALST